MNNKPTLLLMDNVPEFLDTTARLLERYGYHVICATSIDQADCIMREGRVHLAILDVRMNQDEDVVRDISGLELAMSPEHAALPKIILTGYADAKDAATALSSLLPGREVPAALDYVEKRNIDTLLPAIEKAFKKHVNINFNLELHWKQETAFSVLGFIDAESKDVQSRFAERVEEFESLLGQLFREYDHVRVLKMAWRHRHLVALSTIAFRDHEQQSFLVVCGNRADVSAETARLNRFGPWVRPVESTTLCMFAAVTHYAANAYALGSADLQKVVTLRQAFDVAPHLSVKMLEMLCDEVLGAWQREKIPVEQALSLAEWNRQRWGLLPAHDPAVFRKRVTEIEQQAPQLDIEISWQADAVTFQFAGLGRKQHAFRNPEPYIFGDRTGARLKLVTQSPGLSSPDTILVQPDVSKVWLTQFAGAGQLPIYADYAALEAMIRFDWLKTTNAQELYEFEELLNGLEPFAKLDMNSMPASLRPALKLIHIVRKRAMKHGGNDPAAYHTAMLYEAVRRINAHEPGRPMLRNDVAVLVQALFCAAMSAQVIETVQSSNRKPREATALLDVRFDGSEVFISGKPVVIPEQQLKLFVYLHQHAGQLCTHEQLFKLYDPQNHLVNKDTLTTMLTTNVKRLRDLIEPDPDNPQYLINVRGKGYKLLCTPAHPPHFTALPSSTAHTE
jgi:DNA-binding response OmpR family regulator